MRAKIAFTCLILLFCLTPSYAQIAETTAALKRLAKQVEEVTLSNGLKVVLVRRKIAPVFSGAVVAKVGGADELSGKSGISHMLEHMAFKGTKEIGTTNYAKEKILLQQLDEFEKKRLNQAHKDSVTEINQQIANITSELQKLWIMDHFTREYDKRGAVGLNAYTSAEVTAYFVDLPKQAFEFWCFMESERILQPVMRQFYQERDVVLEERRMRFGDDPQGKLYENLLATAFQVHPYGRPVIGFEQDLKRLTAQEVADFHSQYYAASELVIGLAGDIDLATAQPLLEKYFGRIPSKAKAPRPQQIEPKQTKERFININSKHSSQAMLAYHKPNFPNPADPVISILAEVLTGSRLAPLRYKLVEELKIAVALDAMEAPGNRYPNLLIIGFTPKSPHSNETVLKALDEEIVNFIHNFDDEKILENAKRAVAIDFLRNLKSNQGLALSLAVDQTTFGDWRQSINWYEQVMLVSLPQIKAAAKDYLNPNNRTVAFLTRQ